MPRILLPTDFSEPAMNAAVYGVGLFGTEDVSYTLLHTFLAPSTGSTLMWSIDELLMKELQDGLRLTEEKLRQQVDLGKATLDHLCEHGDLPNVVARLTGEKRVDAVVMGTQGVTGLEQVFFGATAADVVKYSHAPVIAVPAGARYGPPRRIVLADDGGEAGADGLGLLLDIARWHRSEVMIVHVAVEGQDEQAAASSAYDELLGAIPHSHHTVSGDNVTTALNDLADQSDADLVVLVHRQRGTFDQIFHRSASKRMVMHAHVPLLVLQQ